MSYFHLKSLKRLTVKKHNTDLHQFSELNTAVRVLLKLLNVFGWKRKN